MLRYLKISDGKLVEGQADTNGIMMVISPDEKEKQMLVDTFKLDAHTLSSSLDPDELARVEFEPEHMALILKSPKNYSSADNFLFKVVSVGLFIFKERLIIVLAEDMPLFDGRQFTKLSSIQDIVLRMLYRTVNHFTDHLKAINAVSEELEHQINRSMENKYLLNMFTLEKSLVYYLRAINANGAINERLKMNAAKIGFSPENLEFLDDLIIENNQCSRQAEIYSNILASLMDARASIVANNLNQLIKILTAITIIIMLPTLVVSIFSMNVMLPLPHEQPVSFWFVIALSAITVLAFMSFWRYKRW